MAKDKFLPKLHSCTYFFPAKHNLYHVSPIWKDESFQWGQEGTQFRQLILDDHRSSKNLVAGIQLFRASSGDCRINRNINFSSFSILTSECTRVAGEAARAGAEPCLPHRQQQQRWDSSVPADAASPGQPSGLEQPPPAPA